MPNLILDLLVDRVDLVDEGANSASFIKMYKRKENEPAMNFDEILAKMKPEHADAIRAEVAKAKELVPEETATELETVTKAKNNLETELQNKTQELEDIAKSKEGKEEPDFEEVMKSLDPSVQEVFKSLKAQKDAAEAVAKEAAEKELESIAKSKATELKSLPVEEAKLVDVLKGVTPEVYDILKAAADAIQDGGMFEEQGVSKSNGGQDNTDDAWSKIEKAADVIVAEEKISKAKAIQTAIKQNPELYREYLKGGAN